MLNNKKLKLYLAAPLFSEAERNFNRSLKKKLLPFFDVYLPQEDGGLMDLMIKAGLPPKLAAEKVFDQDIRALDDCNILLILLDGRTIDEGASFELGYAYGNNKKCYGYKTDPRQMLKFGDNPMIERSLLEIFKAADELLQWAEPHQDMSIQDEVHSNLPTEVAKQI